MKNLSRSAPGLLIAGILALTLAGCGKPTPEGLIDSAKALSAKGDYKAATIQLRNVLQQHPEDGQARFLLGQVLNEQMDYVTAEKELRKALEYSYSPDGVYPALARAMLGEGKSKEVVTELSAKTLSDPEAEAALRTDIGLAHYASGERDEARQAFDAALKAKPGYGRARVGQAMLVASDHDIAGAMKIVDEILTTAPALPEALELKADLLLAQNDAKGAIKVVEQVVTVQPNNFRARYALVTLRIKEREFDAAAADIAAIRKAHPTEPRVAYLDALLAFRQGDATKTRDAVQQVLKMLPNHAPSLFLAGSADYQLRSFDSAAEYLRRVLNQYPQSGETQALLVSTYLKAGRPEKAQELVNPLLRRAPNDPTVLTLAGTAALANNDLANASQYFERAAAIDKNSAQTRTNLGQVRLAMGDTDRAMKDLESASELDATGYKADLALIAAHLQRKEFTAALDAAATLEKKQPDNPLTHNIKGVIYGASGDYKNARASFAKALEVKFDYLPAARNLAGLDIMEKNPEAARGRFETIIAKQPKNEEAIIGLAGVQAATGVPAKDVEATLERALAANPASPAAKIALAEHQLRIGDAKSALAVLQGAAATSPNDVRILDLLAVAQQRAGESNQAIETYRKLAALQPKAPGPLVKLASLQFAAKDYDATLQTLRKALALNPGALDVRVEIANVQAAAGKNDEALAEARAIQKETPKAAAGFAVEGNVHFGQKNWDRAAGAYREAMKRQPSAVVVVRLHSVLENQGKPGEANALATNWVRDNPKDASVRIYLAERALRDKNFKEAARLYKEVLPLQPGSPVVLNNLAWASMEAKDPGALDYAAKAYALAPQSASVLDTYGWILLQNNEVKRAVEVLTAAVNLSPKNPGMRLHLARAQIAAADKPAARKEIEVLFTLEASAEQRAEGQALLKGIW